VCTRLTGVAIAARVLTVLLVGVALLAAGFVAGVSWLPCAVTRQVDASLAVDSAPRAGHPDSYSANSHLEEIEVSVTVDVWCIDDRNGPPFGRFLEVVTNHSDQKTFFGGKYELATYVNGKLYNVGPPLNWGGLWIEPHETKARCMDLEPFRYPPKGPLPENVVMRARFVQAEWRDPLPRSREDATR